MDLIVEILNRDENLAVCWNPGCYYRGNGTYGVGPVGRYGPNTSREKVQEDRQRCKELVAAGISVNTEIPCTLKIRMTISKAEYDNLISERNKLFKDVEYVFETGYKSVINPKYEEQKAAYEKNVKDFETVNEEFQKFIDNCKQKGVNAENFPSKNDDIFLQRPEEYFSVVDKDNGTLEIRLHSQTDLYQYLLKEGILEQRYPKWYRNGEY